MCEINDLNKSNDVDYDNSKTIETKNELIQLTDDILIDTRTDITQKKTISVPIAQLAALGTGVSALIPALRTVTQTTNFDTTGLYRLINGGSNGLKKSKSNFFWGATTESKMAMFEKLDSISVTGQTVMPIDPATIMMAVALASIEKQLSNIAETQKQILSFLETEKEAEIEADIETLTKIISNYKFNWDNNHFIASNHKLVLDIQRTAKKHMLSYKKKVNEILTSKQFFVHKSTVNSTLEDLIRKFQYYRLSLYTFSMASLIEIMLSGNFNEDYIIDVKKGIESSSMTYRELHTQCSVFLEKMSNSSVETNVLKGIGRAGKAVGQFLGSIPFIKEGHVDEFLQDNGTHLKQTADNLQKEAVKSFAEMNNPNTMVFTEKMKDIIQIYNHTAEICFDEEKIYLIADKNSQS